MVSEAARKPKTISFQRAQSLPFCFRTMCSSKILSYGKSNRLVEFFPHGKITLAPLALQEGTAWLLELLQEHDLLHEIEVRMAYSNEVNTAVELFERDFDPLAVGCIYGHATNTSTGHIK